MAINNVIQPSNTQRSVTGNTSGDRTALDVNVLNGGTSTLPEYDALEITEKDGNDNPTEITYYVGGLSGTVVATQTLTYDGSGNFESLEIN